MNGPWQILVVDDEHVMRVSMAAWLKAWVPPTHLSLAELEHRVIEATLSEHGGNVREVAQLLGIDRSTLYEKIKKYDIPR